MRTGRARRSGSTPTLVRVGLGLLGLLLFVAMAAPLLAPYDPKARTGPPFARPSGAHLLGTNDIGQDLLSGLVFGTRTSLLIGLAAASTATLVGTAVGLTAGYLRGWTDAVLMRLVDIVMALPVLPLTLVVGVFVGPGMLTEAMLIAAVLWAGTARELRSQVLSVRELDHVQSARSMGARTRHVLVRHVLPDVAPLVVPHFVLAVRTAILLEAALSFLGLGDPATPSWGTMLSYAQARGAFLTDAWLWWVLPPGLCAVAAVLGFALVGYGLEERGQPALRRAVYGRAPGANRKRARPARHRQEQWAPEPGRPALALESLTVEYDTGAIPFVAVDGVSLSIARGEIVGLVGESGSGKSTLAMTAAGLLHPPARLTAGQVTVGGRNLASLSGDALRRLHGSCVALVPQQAMDALNPVCRVGAQLAEAITLHRPLSRAAAWAEVRELLEGVGVDGTWADRYPHELSGGMRQRAVIAMAVANKPTLLIADEPTTGLDVVVATEILALLAELSRAHDMAMLVISHDLPAVLRLAGRLLVMQGGRIVEEGAPAKLVAAPSHACTRTLLDAVPRLRHSAPAR